MPRNRERLTEKEYWNSKHVNSVHTELENPYREKLKEIFRKIVGEKIFRYMIENYGEYLFWQICRRYLSPKKRLKILEVGSAPGYHLVKFSQMFGYIPYGVEYSKKGVELNREIFSLCNINPNNVIYSDFFSNNFLTEYRNYFDIVMSLGFIEHFSDVKNVIRKHINLLKKGGICLITIPNITGINYLLALLFNRRLVRMHNLEIMKKETLKRLFEDSALRISYLNYYGTFDFGLFQTENYSLLRYLHEICGYLQYILNLVFHILFKEKGLENKLFSPHLICIGRKL